MALIEEAEAGGAPGAVRALLVVAVVLPLVLFAGASWYLRERQLAEGVVHVEQTVQGLEEHALRVFEAQTLIIDVVDRYIEGMDWDTIRTSEDVHRFLERLAAASPHVDGVWLVPPDGRTANSSAIFPFPEVSVADREYFDVLSSRDDLHFGEMIVGRTKGTLNFNLSRRRTPRERFEGIILVTSSIDYFTEVWRQASIYDDMVAGLFREDGEILARYPGLEAIPEKLSPSSPLLQAMQSSDDGVWRSASTLDGSRRIYGFSRVGDTPVHIGFGVEEAAVLADWRRDLVVNGVVASVAAALLFGMGLMVLRQSRGLSLALVSARRTARDLAREVGRRVRAEDVAAENQRLLAEVREATAHRAAVLENMAGGVAAFDGEGRATYCNATLRTILGLAPGEPPDIRRLAAEGVIREADGRPIPEGQDPVTRLLAGEGEGERELRVVPRGETSPSVCAIRSTVLNDPALGVGGGVLTFTDITAQKAEVERREMLSRELDHRVRNMLATIMGMIRLSGASAASKEDLAEELRGRVEAMARTHAFIAQGDWRGVRIGQIVADEVGPYAREERVGIDGDGGLMLAPKEAVDLALVLHELCTNAVKYGAWSNAEGRVSIGWRPQPASSTVRLTWRESGGPRVEPPSRRGFGTSLIRSAFRDGDAGVDIRYEPEGVVCVIDIPVRGTSPLRAPHDRTPPAGRGGREGGGVAGLKVLVAEDEPIVQMELCDVLTSAGAEVVGPASSLAETLDLVEAGCFDAAVLDVNLNGESVGPAARILGMRSTPLLFATGYHSLDLLPEDLRSHARLQKPVQTADLMTWLRRVAADRDTRTSEEA